MNIFNISISYQEWIEENNHQLGIIIKTYSFNQPIRNSSMLWKMALAIFQSQQLCDRYTYLDVTKNEVK